MQPTGQVLGAPLCPPHKTLRNRERGLASGAPGRPAHSEVHTTTGSAFSSSRSRSRCSTGLESRASPLESRCPMALHRMSSTLLAFTITSTPCRRKKAGSGSQSPCLSPTPASPDPTRTWKNSGHLSHMAGNTSTFQGIRYILTNLQSQQRDRKGQELGQAEAWSSLPTASVSGEG